MEFGRKTTAAVIAECAFFVLLNLVGLALIINVDGVWPKVAGMLLVTFGGMGLSTNGHTAAHHAVSRRAWLNELITYFDYPFFLQLSATYWNHKHNVVHHPHPNVIGIDDDADLMPVFTLNDRDLAQATGLRAWWYRRQGYFLPIVLAGNSFGVAFKGWRFLLRALLDPTRRSREHWIDLVCLIAHWLVWIIVPATIFGIGAVTEFYLARMLLMSYVMFVLFAPAHYPEEAIQVTDSAGRDNYLMLQTATAVNFETGPIGRLLCGGVDFQIEHHLFPWISPRHYPKLSPMVRSFCDANGYPYRSQGWGRAIWRSYLTFWRPKRIYEDFPQQKATHPSQSAQPVDVTAASSSSFGALIREA